MNLTSLVSALGSCSFVVFADLAKWLVKNRNVPIVKRVADEVFLALGVDDAAGLFNEVSSSSAEGIYPDGLSLLVGVVAAAEVSEVTHYPVRSWHDVGAFLEEKGIVGNVAFNCSFDDDACRVGKRHFSGSDAACSVCCAAVECGEFNVSAGNEHEKVVYEVAKEGSEFIVIVVVFTGACDWEFRPGKSCLVVGCGADAVDPDGISEG